MSKHVYRIQRRTDGLFSTGGWHPVFNDKGKSWSTRGAVSSHLSNFDMEWKRRHYKDCEVVCYRVVEEVDHTVDVQDWKLAESTVRAKEREEELRIAADKKAKQREIAELERKLQSLKEKS